MRRQHYNVTKPPPHARVDLTHPLGRNCQAVCLFNDGQGTPKVPSGISGISADTYVDSPLVQYYQTLANRIPIVFGPAIPSWSVNAAGKALSCSSTPSGMDMGILPGQDSFDFDFPEFPFGATVSRGETVLVIRRKLDTTARASTLFGVEDSVFMPTTIRCGAHVPYSDGSVYWDYGGLSGVNRLIVAGLTFTTNVEKWIFHAGPRGSAIWRDGVLVGSQTSPLTRTVTSMTPFDQNFGGWMINGGNGLTGSGGDLQEFNFIMYIANQWSDAQCRWWFAEPYAAFYSDQLDARWLNNGEVLAAATVWFDPVLGPNPRNRYYLKRPSMVSTRFESEGAAPVADVAIFDAVFGGTNHRNRSVARRPSLVSLLFEPNTVAPQTAFGCTRFVNERFCSSS